MKLNRRRLIHLFILTAFLSEIFYAAFTFLNRPDGDIPLYMFIYFEGFVLFFFAWLLLKRIGEPAGEDSIIDKSFSARLVNRVAKTVSLKNIPIRKLKLPLFIILTGIIFRLTLFPTTPTTSDDVYRYVWEGKIVINGFNPFTTPPDDAGLEHLKDGIYEKVTYKDVPAIYPPLSQLSFAAAYLISGESLFGLKLLYLLCELLTILFILKLLAVKKRNLNLVLLYAWLPLPVMEYFVNIHLDPLSITFLVMFVYFFETERYYLSPVFLAFSFLSKLLPVLALPLVIKRLGIKRSVYFSAVFILVSLIFYYPFIKDNIHIAEALSGYLANWEFNGSIYNLLKFFTIEPETARIICGVFLVTTIGIISVLYKDFVKATFGVFISIVIFSATLYPWYLGWIASLNPFVNSLAAMSLFFTINFTNLTPLGEVWKEYRFVLLIEYIPFFALLIYDFYRSIKTKK